MAPQCINFIIFGPRPRGLARPNSANSGKVPQLGNVTFFVSDENCQVTKIVRK
jgi:hypothetical protein